MKNKLTFFAILMMVMAIPKSVKAYQFSYTYQGQTLYYNIVDGEAQVTYQRTSSPRYSYLSGALVIPSSVTYNSTTYTVTSIGNSAFWGCGGLTSVTIPNSVTSIGNSAFYNSSFLTSVTIGNSVTSIGDVAFYGCSGLTSVTIPNSVTSIGDGAFGGCSGLTSVIFNADSCTSAGNSYNDRAFHGCSNITNFTFGDNVKVIPSYLCYGLSHLTSVTIPNSVTSIGNSAFRECSGLTSVTIGNSVTSIGEYAFYYCSGLTSITIPNSVTSIGDYAFFLCSGLTSVIYTGTIAQWCGIDFGDSFSNPTSYSHALSINGSPLTNLVISEGVSEIKQYAFYGCTGLTSVTIGNSITSIGDYAFSDCLQISNIHMRNATPPAIQINTFQNVPTSAHIYVPCGALTAYQNASAIWNQYSLEEEFGYSFSAVSADPTKGNVQIVHAPECNNIQAEIQANAYHGFQFVRWSDGNTDAHRYIVITQDTAVEAYFESSQGINDALDGKDIAMYVEDGQIVVRDAMGIDVQVFDMMGRKVFSMAAAPDPCRVAVLQRGVYLVKVGTLPARKMVVR